MCSGPRPNDLSRHLEKMPGRIDGTRDLSSRINKSTRRCESMEVCLRADVRFGHKLTV